MNISDIGKNLKKNIKKNLQKATQQGARILRTKRPKSDAAQAQQETDRKPEAAAPTFRAYIENSLPKIIKELSQEIPISDRGMFKNLVKNAYEKAKEQYGITSTAQLTNSQDANALLDLFKENMKAGLKGQAEDFFKKAAGAYTNDRKPEAKAKPEAASSKAAPSANLKFMDQVIELEKKIKSAPNIAARQALVREAFPDMPPGKESSYLRKALLKLHPDKNKDAPEKAEAASKSFNNIRTLFQ